VATTAQIRLTPAAPPRTRSPLALWHLLSLDAPTVAALWTWFIARASHVRLPAASPIAMAVAVWILYAADRILDARSLDVVSATPPSDLEARHYFHHRHRRIFLAGIVLAIITLATLIPSLDPAASRLYLIEGALLAAWFLILHATPSAHRLAAHRMPKEIAVGLFFSAAVFIPTVARAPGLRPALLPAAILFAVLCSLNCLFIYAWEHAAPGPRRTHATTHLALAHLPALAGAAAIAAVLTLLHHSTPAPIPIACALAAASLLTLHRNRARFSPTHLRAAADLALLTPILLIPFLR
jgi:hypothetical protein